MHKHNIIVNTDSYKSSHYLQYPPGTTQISSYIECRGGKFPQAIFFGLQMYLKEYLSKPIKKEYIDEGEDIFLKHGLPYFRQGWEYILKKHGGYLPLEIEAVPEGMAVPLHNVMLQIINTDPQCFWLTNYVETSLLRAVWYPTTVATLSWYCKDIIRRYMLETCDNLATLPFKLHDFGARGVSSQESAMLGGVAHLVNFEGTDTVLSLISAREYYHEPMAGFSIPAAEHSTLTSWGRDFELAAYTNMLDQFSGKNRLVSVVSDSYDLWSAIDEIWCNKLKERVIHSGGTLVIRPDSGNPAKIVTAVLEKLMTAFGYSINSKGYRVLPNFIRIIQGDEVNLQTIEECLAAMKQKKQSAENISFGMGGALLQKLNRDTLEFALKANAIRKGDDWSDVYKDPITGHSKRSKPGRLALIHDNKGFATIRREELKDRKNLMIPLFRNGEVLKEWNLQEIRQRADSFHESKEKTWQKSGPN